MLNKCIYVYMSHSEKKVRSSLEMADKHLLSLVRVVELEQVDDAGHLVVPRLLLPDAPVSPKGWTGYSI